MDECELYVIESISITGLLKLIHIIHPLSEQR